MSDISVIDSAQKQALLLMFGHIWQKKYSTLDGQKGRPSIDDCIDMALRRSNKSVREDLVDHVERYLIDMSRRCDTDL